MQNKAKSHIMNTLLISNVQSARNLEPGPCCRNSKVTTAMSWSAVFFSVKASLLVDSTVVNVL